MGKQKVSPLRGCRISERLYAQMERQGYKQLPYYLNK
jgi:hypothetical protein